MNCTPIRRLPSRRPNSRWRRRQTGRGWRCSRRLARPILADFEGETSEQVGQDAAARADQPAQRRGPASASALAATASARPAHLGGDGRPAGAGDARPRAGGASGRRRHRADLRSAIHPRDGAHRPHPAAGDGRRHLGRLPGGLAGGRGRGRRSPQDDRRHRRVRGRRLHLLHHRPRRARGRRGRHRRRGDAGPQVRRAALAGPGNLRDAPCARPTSASASRSKTAPSPTTTQRCSAPRSNTAAPWRTWRRCTGIWTTDDRRPTMAVRWSVVRRPSSVRAGSLRRRDRHPHLPRRAPVHRAGAAAVGREMGQPGPALRRALREGRGLHRRSGRVRGGLRRARGHRSRGRAVQAEPALRVGQVQRLSDRGTADARAGASENRRHQLSGGAAHDRCGRSGLLPGDLRLCPRALRDRPGQLSRVGAARACAAARGCEPGRSAEAARSVRRAGDPARHLRLGAALAESGLAACASTRASWRCCARTATRTRRT